MKTLEVVDKEEVAAVKFTDWLCAQAIADQKTKTGIVGTPIVDLWEDIEHCMKHCRSWPKVETRRSILSHMHTHAASGIAIDVFNGAWRRFAKGSGK